jgi:hypothetical protein
MKEDQLALLKAVDSGDTDLGKLDHFITIFSSQITIALVYQVLLHLQKRLALGSFFKLIEDGGPQLRPARHLLEVYAREQNREMLRDFYYSDDRRVESAVLCLEEAAAYKVRLMTESLCHRNLKTANKDPHAVTTAVKNARKFFSEDKDRGFETKV